MLDTQDAEPKGRRRVAINKEEGRRKRKEEDVVRGLLKKLKGKGEAAAVEMLLDSNNKKKVEIQGLKEEVKGLRVKLREGEAAGVRASSVHHGGFTSIAREDDVDSVDSLGVIHQLESDCSHAHREIAALKMALTQAKREARKYRTESTPKLHATTQCSLPYTSYSYSPVARRAPSSQQTSPKERQRSPPKERQRTPPKERYSRRLSTCSIGGCKKKFASTTA